MNAVVQSHYTLWWVFRQIMAYFLRLDALRFGGPVAWHGYKRFSTLLVFSGMVAKTRATKEKRKA